jgi:hypothetical protein
VSPCDDGIVISSVNDLPSAEVVALFSDAPRRGELPHSIVIAKSNLREFFAWASTYLGHWSPLTARVRVVRRIELSDLQFGRPLGQRLSPEASRGLASLIIGEALCEWSLAGEKSNPTLLSLRSTFSYAASEALRKRQLDVHALFDAWERAQRILKLGPRRIARSCFLNVWEPIASCLAGNGNSIESVGHLGGVLAELVRSMRLPTIPLADAEPLFGRLELDVPNKRREDTVVDLENWLSRKSTDRPVDKVFTACLATRLSPAALSHFDVLAKMTNSEPEPLLWYSFISGLLASEPSGQVVERLLFKLSGEFDDPLRDHCGDISLDELDVLAQSDGHVAPWIGSGAGYLNVELKAGICASFRLRDRMNGAAGTGQVRTDLRQDKQHFDGLLEQLRALYAQKTAPTPKKRRKR